MAIIVLAGAVAIALPANAAAQFGKGLMKGKTEVVMKRRTPPRVVVSGTSFKVEVSSQTDRPGLPARFREAVEAKLATNDPSVRVGRPEPDTIVRCTIPRLDIKQTAGSRVVSAMKQTGTKQELNKKTGKMDTVPVYENVSETKYFTSVHAELRVETEVRVVKANALVEARGDTAVFDQEYAAGVVVPERDIEATLITQGARIAAAAVTFDTYNQTVMLGRPNGDVDDKNKLAEAGLWSRMADELERMKPLSDKKKDAYRLFNIGVANEAQAYAAADLAAAKTFLERASAMYAQALQQTPDEEYFQPPITRVADSIARYVEFARQQSLIASGGLLPDLTPPGSGGEPAAKPARAAGEATVADKPMTNKDVIDLKRAGLSEENLIAAIKDAKAVKFDLSVDGLKALLAASVPNAVVSAMRARR